MATATATEIRTERKVKSLEGDLEICIEALLDIRDGNCHYPDARAKTALWEIETEVTCGNCGGEGSVVCGHCNGGGSRDFPCPVCGSSGCYVCGECHGKGKV